MSGFADVKPDGAIIGRARRGELLHHPVELVREQADLVLALERQARSVRPKLLIAGASAYPRIIDFERMAAIAHGVDALLMVDMAHIAGLVAAGVHPSPFPEADIVTSTTHKTLRGARGGLIFAKPELARAIDRGVFPGTQGGPLMHAIAGKAVAFKEALSDDFRAYQGLTVANAKAAVEGLTRSLAVEFAPRIRVNAIAPSLTDTPLAQNLLASEEKRKASADRHPLKRIGRPQEIAGTAAHLLSDTGAWITGQVIPIDGGMSTLRTFR